MFRSRDLPATLGEGTYRLVRLLGRGGMGAVYEAEVDLDRFDLGLVITRREALLAPPRDGRDSQRIHRYQSLARLSRTDLEGICQEQGYPYPASGRAAVKVLSEGMLSAQRFRSEWRRLLSIDHPNLITVYAGGHDEGQDVHYYAMEIFDSILAGRDLLALPIADRLAVVVQAARGLHALHGHGIIHRDVKPDNLITFRDEGGALRVKVSDLGIAKDTNLTVPMTLVEQAMGSPNFMSPEQARAASSVDASSDVYSLGATLYLLVCGQAPYQGRVFLEVARSLAEGIRPVAPRSLVGDGLPGDLEELIVCMMDHRPEERPELPAVVEAIQRILAAAPASFRLDAHFPSPEAYARTCPVECDGSTARRPSILIVDDEISSRRLLERFLGRDHEVVLAADGADALLQIGFQRFDLIVSDVNMPNLDGLKLLEILRLKGVEVPVILLSGGTSSERQEEARRLGAEFLAKPFELTRLSEAVGRALAPPARQPAR